MQMSKSKEHTALAGSATVHREWGGMRGGGASATWDELKKLIKKGLDKSPGMCDTTGAAGSRGN